MIKLLNLCAFLFACILATGASASETVGSAKRIVNVVTGNDSGVKRGLNADDPIFRDERISADGGSSGELILTDGSKIIVGENSSITLDNFAVGEKGFKSGTISVAKGAFRFISGSSPKGAIKFKTPLASVGVRGTTLDLYVGDGGVTRVVVLSGRVTACSLGGRCIDMNRSCDIVEIRGRSDISELPFLRSKQRDRNTEAEEYGLTEQQARHSSGWRAPMAGCSVRAAFETRGVNPNGGDGDRKQRVEEATPPPPPSTPETPDEDEVEVEDEVEDEDEDEDDGTIYDGSGCFYEC
jgi:hypothetical protein